MSCIGPLGSCPACGRLVESATQLIDPGDSVPLGAEVTFKEADRVRKWRLGPCLHEMEGVTRTPAGVTWYEHREDIPAWPIV